MKINYILITFLFFVLATLNLYSQEEIDTIVKYNTKKFDKDVGFFNKTFTAGANFDYKEFNSEFEISNSQFYDKENSNKASFSSSEFKGKVTLASVLFNTKTDFTYSIFNSIVLITNAKFNNVTKFTDAKFNDIVSFTGTEFNNETDFSNVIFGPKVFFNKAKINSDINFSNATLPEFLDFSLTKISSEIDLTLSNTPTSGVCSINLVGASISSIRFRYKRFKLWFQEKDSSNYELKSSVYEALLNKQQSEGFTESYEKLDKEYKAFKYTDPGYKKGKWGQLQNFIDKHWWGYGYNKELIVLNSILLYLIFSFFNSFILKHLTLKVYDSDKINEYWNETSGSKLTLFFKSIPFSLFYTAQIFFGYKFNMDKLKYKENLQGWKIFNLVYFITIHLSGLVCLAYLMNYILTV
jgi:Pentapeptide repeats (9 copies)